jgi:hypothetical protein
MSGKKSNSRRGLNSRFEQTLKITDFRIKKYMEDTDRIHLPFTLEDLRKAKNDPKTKKKLQKCCEQLAQSDIPSRPFSAIYLDANGKLIFSNIIPSSRIYSVMWIRRTHILLYGGTCRRTEAIGDPPMGR